MGKIPEFRSEDEERAFWSDTDSFEYIDWSKAKRVMLPNIKPSLKTISLRLPSLCSMNKTSGPQRDVPIRRSSRFISDRLRKE
jgi:hypothetical protein